MANLLLEDPEFRYRDTGKGIWREFLYTDEKRFREYKSHRTVGDRPWLHVTVGINPETGKHLTARGFIAIGRVAKGTISIGQLAIGTIAIGQLALGKVGAIGQAALAPISIGQLGIGLLMIGQISVAWYAIGQTGIAIVGMFQSGWILKGF